jgi:organic radical activating enzyme
MALRVAEVFLSLQGEGPAAGTPAHFLRLQGCDVGCRWCDTKYTWDAAGGEGTTIEQAFARAAALGEAPLIVITGGEPLQHAGIDALLDAALARWPRVEVETSGVEPPPRSEPRLHWNVSPKLAGAGGRHDDTWRHVAAWSAEPNATFKLVIASEADLAEALERIDTHALPRERTMLMPEGLTDETLRERARWLADACKRHGLRMSPRLHVWLWGARRGV